MLVEVDIVDVVAVLVEVETVDVVVAVLVDIETVGLVAVDDGLP